MPSIISRTLCGGLLLCFIELTASAPASLPVIPGAAGFGVSTPAGSGRHVLPVRTTVYKVTTLNASGPGSLQACIYARGPRTCVFEVSGTIDLTGDKSYDGSAVINLKNPYITIAGQTAPSPGITIRGKTLRIEAHDVLIQHLRFRVGDSPEVLTAPGVRDTLLIAGAHDNPGRTPHNIVIDHCSISWAIDELVSIKDSSHHITISNSILSEGLDRSLHPKGRHSKGLMAVGNYLSIYRNLIASVVDRAPLDISPNSIYINNVSSNAKYATFSKLTRSSWYAGKSLRRRTVVLGNVRNISKQSAAKKDPIWGLANPNLSDGSMIFFDDNRCRSSITEAHVCAARNLAGFRVPRSPLHGVGIEVWPAIEVQSKVLAGAGARPGDRDMVDRRIVREVESGLGQVPDCVSEKPIYYPRGLISAGSDNKVIIKPFRCFEGRFVGQTIEVGKAAHRQSSPILKHACVDSNTSVLTLGSRVQSISAKNPPYRIVNQCTNHAGGFPVLAENTRVLSIPTDHNQISATGYTRLEDYLHEFYREVE